MSSSYVNALDGLVARNPANLPSDIQRIRFVYRPELEPFKDVLIFSSKGERSLASLLSGGDYDGDTCWATWDQNLVRSFTNYSNGPPDHITPEECGLVNQSTKLSTVFRGGYSADSVTTFLKKCIGFNLQQPMVGQCTTEHEALVYHQRLDHDGAIRFAALASFLVDARKQGYELSQDSFNQFRANCSGKRKLATPAFKAPDVEGPFPHNPSNVVDYLRFKVASPARTRLLELFYEKWPSEIKYDAEFAEEWKDAQDAAPDDPMLAQLQQDLQQVYKTWLEMTKGNKDAEHEAGQFPNAIRACYQQYLGIGPLEQPGIQARILGIQNQWNRPRSFWSQLKASCFYSLHWKLRLVWHLAGDELCFMKNKQERLPCVTSQMNSVMKIDAKAVKTRFAGDLVDGEKNEILAGPMDRFVRRY
jgi:hypothetical protein